MYQQPCWRSVMPFTHAESFVQSRSDCRIVHSPSWSACAAECPRCCGHRMRSKRPMDCAEVRKRAALLALKRTFAAAPYWWRETGSLPPRGECLSAQPLCMRRRDVEVDRASRYAALEVIDRSGVGRAIAECW